MLTNSWLQAEEPCWKIYTMIFTRGRINAAFISRKRGINLNLNLSLTQEWRDLCLAAYRYSWDGHA